MCLAFLFRVSLFTAVLNDRLYNFLEYNEMLHENQAGFRKYNSTTEHIFTLYLFSAPMLTFSNNANVQYLNLVTTVLRKLMNIQIRQLLIRS